MKKRMRRLMGIPMFFILFLFSIRQTYALSAMELEWRSDGNSFYWYEDGVRQGTSADPKGVYGDGTNRGREIYDPSSDGWYWLDAVYDGARAVSKEVWMPYVYQEEDQWSDAEKSEIAEESDAGMADNVRKAMAEKTGKWVRYDESGKMLKGWVCIEGSLAEIYPEQEGNIYYYDTHTGLMAKGRVTIGGYAYSFDEVTGALDRTATLGRMMFVGDSRTVDMFSARLSGINQMYQDGIVVFARDGARYKDLVHFVDDYGMDNFDTLITWMGANDAGEFSPYGPYYDDLLAAGKRLIVCTVGPSEDDYLDDEDADFYNNFLMKRFNNGLRGWAQNRDVPVIDLYGFVPRYYACDPEDGIHYIPQPTTKIWEYIVQSVQNLSLHL